MTSTHTHVFKEKSWEPVVDLHKGQLIYNMPVSCGYFDKSFKFEITKAQFEILKDDVERRYFLYAVLHHLYQPKPMQEAHHQDRHFDLILSGSKSDVEALLTHHDTQSNGIVSNLAAAFLPQSQAEMRQGRWFLDSDDPA